MIQFIAANGLAGCLIPTIVKQCESTRSIYYALRDIGSNSQSKPTRSVAAMVTNVHDSQALNDLLHVTEARVWGDSGENAKGSAVHEAPGRVVITRCQRVNDDPAWRDA